MGGAVSSGRNNDDLIDNLLSAEYIKSPLVESVFRAVDRGEYFLQDSRSSAYKDLAWKSGNLHLSAPCIYSEVMEGLCLKPGLSFLNLGSGTGYLSTMVGLILGPHGINHGIEVYEDVIQYANQRLEDFKKYSGAIDDFDFCEPKFIQGNCLSLSTECHGLYDRVYCGAACPERYKDYMKNLVREGGILVIPVSDQLFQMTRVTKTQWQAKTLLPVSFASLIIPREESRDLIRPIEVEPLSLQVSCRSVVRTILRKNIQTEHPPIKRYRPARDSKRKRVLKRLVVPLFDESTDDEEDLVRVGGHSNAHAGRLGFRREDNDIFRFFFGMGMRMNEDDDPELPRLRRCLANHPRVQAMDVTNTLAEDAPNQEDDQPSTSQEVTAVIEHHPDPQPSNENMEVPQQDLEHNADRVVEINELNDVIVECLEALRRERSQLQAERIAMDAQVSDSDDNEENDDNEAGDTSSNAGDAPDESEAKPSTSTTTESKTNGKREKVDSGLGDEIVEAQGSSEDDDNSASRRPISKFRKVEHTAQPIPDSSSDTEEDSKQTENDLRMYQSPITVHMKAKIQELPLPPILKKYLNYSRDI